MTVPEIIDKYEIPKEYHKALWEAYESGADRLIQLQIQQAIEKELAK
jgi:hypothetical protein